MDDVDMTRSPIVLLIAAGAALLLFYLLYRSSRRVSERAAQPRQSISYESVATPIAKANAKLRAKFPALAGVGSEEGIELVRFGIFNWSEVDLADSQIDQPIAARFAEGSEVLSAALGETIKADITLPEPPTVTGCNVVFPKFAIPAHGTVIFNIIVRGKGRLEAVAGRFEGWGPLRRLG